MIPYLSDPTNSTRELLRLIKNFSKVTGYKINSNKLVALLYSNYKQAEKEIRAITPFTIVTNNIKYMGLSDGTTTMEIILAVPQKSGHDTSGVPCCTSPGHIPRGFPGMQ